jgi:nicotinate-nucleotide adenylyltransferase
MTGVFGGTFDPPHIGHSALLQGARRHFGFKRVLVLVVADPGHRDVVSSAAHRLALARAAFAGEEVELDRHARTVDMLRARKLADPVLILGADELADLPTWKAPEQVIALARLAVGARPGYVVPAAASSDRILTFEIDPVDVSSTEIRRRVAVGEPIDGLVLPAVAAEIERLGLYRDYTARGRAQETEPN